MYRIFDKFFREKLGPIEQHNRIFAIKNAIKHQLFGSYRTTHSAKILGDPPRISVLLIYLVQDFNYMLSEKTCFHRCACIFQVVLNYQIPFIQSLSSNNRKCCFESLKISVSIAFSKSQPFKTVILQEYYKNYRKISHIGPKRISIRFLQKLKFLNNSRKKLYTNDKLHFS